MATSTPNLGLILPDISDPVSLNDLNTNFSTIDSVFGSGTPVKSQTLTKSSSTVTNITVPSLSRHFLICTTNGGSSGLMIGYVQASTNGGITFYELAKGSDTTITTSSNNVTLTLGTAREWTIIDFVVYGNECA